MTEMNVLKICLLNDNPNPHNYWSVQNLSGNTRTDTTVISGYANNWSDHRSLWPGFQFLELWTTRFLTELDSRSPINSGRPRLRQSVVWSAEI